MTSNKDLRCQFCNWLNKEVQDTFTCRNCGRNNINKIVEEQKVKEDSKIENNWIEEVDNIKGIGPETLADIKRQFETREELIEALKTNKAPFRNDIVKKLNLYFML